MMSLNMFLTPGTFLSNVMEALQCTEQLQLNGNHELKNLAT